MVCQMNFTLPHCDQIVTVQTGLQAGQMGSDHITEKLGQSYRLIAYIAT